MSYDDLTLDDFNFVSTVAGSQEEVLEKQIAWLTKLLDKKQKQKEALVNKWPKPYKVYLRNNKGICHEGKLELGLSKDVDFFPAWEVCFEGTVDENGIFICYSINGINLVVPVEL